MLKQETKINSLCSLSITRTSVDTSDIPPYYSINYSTRITTARTGSHAFTLPRDPSSFFQPLSLHHENALHYPRCVKECSQRGRSLTSLLPLIHRLQASLLLPRFRSNHGHALHRISIVLLSSAKRRKRRPFEKVSSCEESAIHESQTKRHLFQLERCVSFSAHNSIPMY